MLKRLWQIINFYLEQKWFLVIVILINFLGSIYGFYWYKNQLLQTPTIWLIFVPDSPMASSFFTIFLILYIYNKKSPFIEALASVTMFKYGIWATAIIIWGALAIDPSFTKLITLQTIDGIDLMLMSSHLAMAIAALLFYKKYSYGFLSIILVGLWTLTNDFIDYTKDVHPWLPRSIASIDDVVGRYTFYLSGFTLILFYVLTTFSRKGE